MISLLAMGGCGEKSNEIKKGETRAKIMAAEELMLNSNCLACHTQGNSMRLPTWRDVAKRYKGKKKAEKMLVDKLAHGGSGAWGNMDMPPYPELSEAERTVIIRGILADH
ncbi:MAG: c-type cytochrome [Gallionellaceae bacterium]